MPGTSRRPRRAPRSPTTPLRRRRPSPSPRRAASTTPADSGSGVNKVEVAIQDGSGNYYDGSGFNNAGQTFLLASGTTSWSYAIASSKLSDGHTYHITVKTTDNTTTANSDNNAASRSFTYDTTPPTAAFTFPAAGGFYNASGWSGSITGPAADSGSAVNKVEVAIHDGSGNHYATSG